MLKFDKMKVEDPYSSDLLSEVKWRNNQVNKIPEIAVEFCPRN